MRVLRSLLMELHSRGCTQPDGCTLSRTRISLLIGITPIERPLIGSGLMRLEILLSLIPVQVGERVTECLDLGRSVGEHRMRSLPSTLINKGDFDE